MAVAHLFNNPEIGRLAAGCVAKHPVAGTVTSAVRDTGRPTQAAALLGVLADLALSSGRLAAGSWLTVAQTPFALLGPPLIATFGTLLFPDRPLGSRSRRFLAKVYAHRLLRRARRVRRRSPS